MSYEMSVTFMGDYVEAHSTGDKSYQTAVTLWREILRVCAEHKSIITIAIRRTNIGSDHIEIHKRYMVADNCCRLGGGKIHVLLVVRSEPIGIVCINLCD